MHKPVFLVFPGEVFHRFTFFCIDLRLQFFRFLFRSFQLAALKDDFGLAKVTESKKEMWN